MNKCEDDFSPLIFEDTSKEEIQRVAFQKWLDNDCKGTLEMATGVGKTMIGLMTIQKFAPADIVIVVPKVDLQNQWHDEITKNLGDYKSINTNIGRIGNGYSDIDKPIKICIVNSIREAVMKADLLILDEIHRYGSQENFKFLENGEFKRILGLTATSARQDGAEEKIFEYAPLVYKFSQGEAIKAGALSGYHLINKQIGLTMEERMNYSRQEDFIKENFKLFGNDFNAVQTAVNQGGVRSHIAADLMRAFSKRRQIVLNASNRINTVIDIINAHKHNKLPKTMVFCEYIKTANSILKELKRIGVNGASYHSNMGEDKRKKALEGFKNNQYDILVSVKSLDEGTNIPDCEVAIIAAGTSVKRQMIQRLGRILRTNPGKPEATIYNFYIPETVDYRWFKESYGDIGDNALTVRWE